MTPIEQLVKVLDQVITDRVNSAVTTRLSTLNSIIDKRIEVYMQNRPPSDSGGNSPSVPTEPDVPDTPVNPNPPVGDTISVCAWNIASTSLSKTKFATDAEKYNAFYNQTFIDNKAPDLLGICEYTPNIASTFSKGYTKCRTTDANLANVCNNAFAHNYQEISSGCLGFKCNLYGSTNTIKLYNYIWQSIIINGKKVLVIVTHLMPADSAAATDNSEAAKKAEYYYNNIRKPQMDSIKARINEWITNVSPYVIVMGDFNVSGADKIYLEPFTNSKGTTKWLTFNWQTIPFTYINGKNSMGGILGENSIPDNIITHGFEVVSAEMDTSSVNLSDHYALKCKLKFK